MESYGYLNVLNLMEETFKYGFYIPVEMACNSTDAVWTDRLLFPGVK